MELKDNDHHTQVHVHVATTNNTKFSITCRKMMCQGTAVHVESRRTAVHVICYVSTIFYSTAAAVPNINFQYHKISYRPTRT
jgi:pentose-5-phosphate-3-epimerase